MRHREEMLERKAKEALARKKEDSDDSLTAIAEKDEGAEGASSDEEAYDADATDSDVVEHLSDADSERAQPGVGGADEKVALVDRPIDDDSGQNPKNNENVS
jgi:hypothetical protein